MSKLLRVRRIAVDHHQPGYLHWSTSVHYAAVVEVDAATTWVPHQHDNWEVIITQRGMYRCRINCSEHASPPGGAILICSGDLHEDMLAAGVVYAALRLSLQGTIPGAFDLSLIPAAGGRAVVGGLEVCAGLIEQVIYLDGVTGTYARQAQEALAGAVFWFTQGEFGPGTQAAARALRDRIAAIIQAHLNRPVTVAELAVEAGLPERTLTARCRKLFGDSPARLLLRARCDAAVPLLRAVYPSDHPTLPPDYQPMMAGCPPALSKSSSVPLLVEAVAVGGG